MNAHDIINQCREYKAVLIPEGDKLKVSAPTPLPDDLRAELREYKQDIIRLLTKPKLVNNTPQWNAESVNKAVKREGYCLFWSEYFGDLVAFIKEGVYREHIPAGVAVYTLKEITMLFDKRAPVLSDNELRLIHETKKHNGNVIDRM